jgi:hypothetical protein
MPSTARKLNFMIREDIARELGELVPPGKRSKVVNEALEKELLSIKRRMLTGKLLSIREQGPSVSTKDLVALLRKDRKRH